ncbi:hypothetical protein T439DRAFT_324914 [Meredithblackwellia eburnea MCA 4105]
MGPIRTTRTRRSSLDKKVTNSSKEQEQKPTTYQNQLLKRLFSQQSQPTKTNLNRRKFCSLAAKQLHPCLDRSTLIAWWETNSVLPASCPSPSTSSSTNTTSSSQPSSTIATTTCSSKSTTTTTSSSPRTKSLMSRDIQPTSTRSKIKQITPAALILPESKSHKILRPKPTRTVGFRPWQQKTIAQSLESLVELWEGSQSRVIIPDIQLDLDHLVVGAWARTQETKEPIHASLSPSDKTLQWTVQSEEYLFRASIPFALISTLTITPQSLQFALTSSPSFESRPISSPFWIPCLDFTLENPLASASSLNVTFQINNVGQVLDSLYGSGNEERIFENLLQKTYVEDEAWSVAPSSPVPATDGFDVASSSSWVTSTPSQLLACSTPPSARTPVGTDFWDISRTSSLTPRPSTLVMEWAAEEWKAVAMSGSASSDFTKTTWPEHDDRSHHFSPDALDLQHQHQEKDQHQLLQPRQGWYSTPPMSPSSSYQPSEFCPSSPTMFLFPHDDHSSTIQPPPSQFAIRQNFEQDDCYYPSPESVSSFSFPPLPDDLELMTPFA